MPESEGEGDEQESRSHGAEAREGSIVVAENPLTETPIVSAPAASPHEPDSDDEGGRSEA